MAFHLTDDQFRAAARLLHDAAGLQFDASNRSVLERSLQSRLRSLQCDAAGYLRRLTADDRELKLLLSASVNGTTRFFRNRAQLEALRAIALPALVGRRGRDAGGSLRVWSAGCSTGEEAYTLAISLRELLPEGWRLSIQATDVSESALARAAEGLYHGIEAVPATLRGRFFLPVAGGYRVSPEIRELVSFSRHALGEAGAPAEADIVSCRNVLYYLSTDARRRALRQIWEALSPDGFLVVGNAERADGPDDLFRRVKGKGAILYRKYRVRGFPRGRGGT
ncbi:MAG TPA: protein-glutamate O-methyltransferase CheR [Spirochaetia bacterium]|nr:protein-glutamate O-methyltransferase CheR [Spirochaetia bacterium]